MSENEKIKQHMTRADRFLILACLLGAAVLAMWFCMGKREGRTLRISWEGATMERLALPLKPKERGDVVSGENGILYCMMLYTEGGIGFSWYGERPDQKVEWAKTREISYNLLAVSGDRVWMEAAGCRDQFCVHHLPVNEAGESIICLPNRLVVEIADDSDGEKFHKMVQ